MKPLRRRVAATVLAALSATLATPSAAADRRVTIVNDTGYTIVRFYASSENASSWEEDILGQDTLKPGKSVRINMDDGTGACMFDFKAVFSDGDVMTRKGIDVCKIATYRYH